MKKTIDVAKKFSFLLAFGFLMSCATEYVATQPEGPTVVEKVSPGPTYVWMAPEWKWDGGKKTYVYVPGDWVNRPNGVWVTGHWVKVKNGWKWVPGHWR